ncbi:hypothetical protein [Lysobacter gummosus]|uniref:hypothetical protein n=1 Tax=Lysobacter gummosus TaxID=262324 RepID=UPI0036267E33
MDFAVAIQALVHWTAGGPNRSFLDRRTADLNVRRDRCCVKRSCLKRCCGWSWVRIRNPRFGRPRRGLFSFPARRSAPGVRPNARLCRANAGTHPIIPCEAIPAGGQFSSFMPRDRPR